MKKDYAKKTNTTRRTPTKRNSRTRATKPAAKAAIRPANSRAGLIWMLAGLLVGLLIAGLVYLKLTAKEVKKTNTVHIEQKQRSTKAKTKQRKAEKPKFEFYTILPSIAVDLGRAEPTQKVDIPKPIPQNTITNKHYAVQVTAVRNRKDAERIRAQLALLGFEAKIATTTQKGITWNRVYIGPYTSQKVAHAAQEQLKQQGMNSIIVRKKYA